MNWLAHLHLSGDSPAMRIGNLLPDLMKGPELREISELFSEGIRLHRRIDSYTDQHPIFRQSRTRIDPALRRYSPILIDLFYDHFLAKEWASYSPVPLDSFIDEFHASIEVFRPHLTDVAYRSLVRIRDGNYLLSYLDTEGMTLTLERVSRRLRKYVDLRSGIDSLLSNDEELAADFRAFYPQLVEHVNS